MLLVWAICRGGARESEIDVVISAVDAAGCMDQMEDAVNSFLGDEMILDAEEAHRLDRAIAERSNDVYYSHLQQSFHTDAFPGCLVEALKAFGSGDWGKSP